MRNRLARRIEQMVIEREREREHARFLPSNQQVDEIYPRVSALD